MKQKRPMHNVSSAARRVFCNTVFASALDRIRTLKTALKIARTREKYRLIPRSHFHPWPEIFFQLGGATDFECPGESFRLKAPRIGIIPTAVAHAETPVNLRTPYSVLICGRRPDGFYLIHSNSPDGRHIRVVFSDVSVNTRGRDAFQYLDEIASADDMKQNYRRVLIEGLLNAFLVTLMNELTKPPHPIIPAPPSKIVAVENLVRSHLSNYDLSVNMLAESLHCSSDYLSKLFHAERKITLSRWILQERVAMARELLLDPKYNIAEVGWACGFSGASYFIRVFREHTGYTPYVFRKMIQPRFE